MHIFPLAGLEFAPCRRRRVAGRALGQDPSHLCTLDKRLQLYKKDTRTEMKRQRRASLRRILKTLNYFVRAVADHGIRRGRIHVGIFLQRGVDRSSRARDDEPRKKFFGIERRGADIFDDRVKRLLGFWIIVSIFLEKIFRHAFDWR